MSDNKFNDGGDALGSSEYFTGGCGCGGSVSGGVEGGGYFGDNGFMETGKNALSTLRDLVGGGHLVKAWELKNNNMVDAVSYFALAIVQFCLITMIVLFAMGYPLEFSSAGAGTMTLMWVGSAAALTVVGTEIYSYMQKNKQA